MMAAITRHWSTVIQGTQTDYAKWKADVATWIAYAKKQMAGQAPAPKQINVTDAASAMQDMQQSMGSVPDFAKKFPPQALAGAWKEERDVEMSPNTALSGKNKSLIGLAVAAQVPCKYCVEADTEFARLEGATEPEIQEAIAMAALTRHWSTYLNGTMADEAQLRRDVDRLVKGAKKMKPPQKPAEVSQAPAPAAPKPMAAVMKPGQAAPEQSAKPTGKQ
jgi:AhpD family alkylhydroperoxidase